MATSTSTTVREGGDNFYVHALLGAVVTVVASFVPFSPLLGGALAGYLHDRGTDRGTRVGVVAGIMAAIPLGLLFFLLATVMAGGSLLTGEFAGPMFVLVLVGVILLVAALYIVGLSALGGYIGGSYAQSRHQDATDAVERPE